MKKAVISGVTGQDGSYLAEQLLDKGYDVTGLIRRVSSQDQAERMKRISHIDNENFHLLPCDITCYGSVYQAMANVQPDEVYHLAAQSNVHHSFEDSFQTLDTNVIGTNNMLEATFHNNKQARFYFAASSEMFGDVLETPQTEETPFNPRSPYGVAKVAGFYLTKNFRERGFHASSGILFNHESERRGEEFVTQKIARGIAECVKNSKHKIPLGNLDAKRDWGYSPDYTKAMWLMLQQDKPDDYVISTGETHTVQEFLQAGFGSVGLDWQKHVYQDARFMRPTDVELLLGDSAKARSKLGWEPETHFNDLVTKMVAAQL